jgi:hypothetical protein
MTPQRKTTTATISDVVKRNSFVTRKPFQANKKKGIVNASWKSKYLELQKFHESHQQLPVPANGPLYKWMTNQRCRAKGTGSGSPHSLEQRRLLDDLGFDWVSSPEKGRKSSISFGSIGRENSTKKRPFEDLASDSPGGRKQGGNVQGEIGGVSASWKSKYLELQKFHESHQQLPFPANGPLYTWMTNQRCRAKGTGSGSPHSLEQRRLLDDLGFDWAGSPEKGRKSSISFGSIGREKSTKKRPFEYIASDSSGGRKKGAASKRRDRRRFCILEEQIP